MLNQLKKDFLALADKNKAKLLSGFFKTGKGEYGEGDIFLGLIVPKQRILAKRYKDLPISKIQTLLRSKIHEHRLTALFILVQRYKKAGEAERGKIFKLYLNNNKNINNWDLVDLSAPNIIGNYLLKRDRSILYKMAKSKLLWDRRIAIMATFMFIKYNDFKDSLAIAALLLKDKHDLIHKAVGWMLREIGKRDMAVEEVFLKKHHKMMPRTMLRYSLEKFPEQKKRFYMNKD